MEDKKINISFDKTEDDFIISWEDESGGVYLITIENGDHDIMVSYSSKQFSKGWRKFIELFKK